MISKFLPFRKIELAYSVRKALENDSLARQDHETSVRQSNVVPQPRDRFCLGVSQGTVPEPIIRR
jgi:hypothetical protein